MTDAADGRIASSQITHDGLTPTSLAQASIARGTDALKDIIFGSIAGVIGKTIEYPFDTVKVRLQSQPSQLPLRYIGPLDCFQQSFREEGITGLYRGISAPLIGAAIETSSLFFSYRIAQCLLQATFVPPADHNPLPLSALVACGAASGAFTSLLLTPIELVKCQMQVPPSSGGLPSSGPLSIISSIFHHHGILGFWHGQLGTLIRETGGSAAWFGSYEGVSALFRTYDGRSSASSTSVAPATVTSKEVEATLPIYQQLLAGATAGVSYNFLFFPADTIKSRMQSEGINAGGQIRQTFWASGKALWQQQGTRGMYRGCGITVARAAPSSAFIFAVYEELKGWWG